MNFQEALNAKSQIASLLDIDGPRTRSDRRGVAVGLAPKPVAQQDFRIAIRAKTQEQLDDILSSDLGERIRTLAASELDMAVTGPIVAGPLMTGGQAKRQLRIGASVSHHRCGAGSLGFFARRGVDGAIGFVSNNHILALSDRGKDGEEILHPGKIDKGVAPIDIVARLCGDYPRLDVEQARVDCAFARLSAGVQFDPAAIEGSLTLKADPVPARGQREVLKRGRTTGLTRGRIAVLALDGVEVEYPSGYVFFNQQIEIRSFSDEEHFAEPGDSGSVVVNPEGHPLGLLFAGTADCRRAYANPIEAVLTALGVTVLT